MKGSDIFMTQDVFVEAHISDLHFGVIDPLTEYNILTKQFLDYLDSMNVLDIVSVNGDIFDHKLMANSDAVMYTMHFMYRLIDICKRKNSTLILISGTASHDADQLKLFYPLVNTRGCDIRIVLEAQFLFVKGKKILCIPELYNMGEKYYSKLLFDSGTYDSCYMHGTFKGAIRNKNEHDLDSNREPVFDMEDFRCCLGPIISGHNHVNSIYKKHFHYCGSPIRWCFGEENDKGFLILIHNIHTRQYIVHLEPIYSFIYSTINLDDILNTDPQNIIRHIENLKNNGIDKLRVIFTKNDVEKIALIKNYFHNKRDIKIKTDFELTNIEEKLEEMNTQFTQYSYLFDKNLSATEKLVQYINQEENSTIWTAESLTKFIKELKNI